MSFNQEPPHFQTTNATTTLATQPSWLAMPPHALARYEYLVIATDHNTGHAFFFFEFIARRQFNGVVAVPAGLVNKRGPKTTAATTWDANPVVPPGNTDHVAIQVNGGVGQTVDWAVFPLSCIAMTDSFTPPP